jgi:superfamily II DNA/RNA helicase
VTFADLPLLPTLVASLSEQGLMVPTPVQEQSIPPLLEGKSLVAVAETGSGKTLAFVLPLLHRLKSLELEGDAVSTESRPRGLILVPGRELGEQVRKVCKSLTHGTRVRVRSALGGTKKQIARQNVKGAFEVLVATPGRLEQLVNNNELYLDDVRTVVFDEADQMLDPGFLPAAKRILKRCRTSVQLVMVSATLPQTLNKAVDALYATPPVRVRTKGSERLVPTLRTDNRTVQNGRRFDTLREVLDEDARTPTMLFVNTHDQCDALAEWLDAQDLPYVAYRGQMERTDRRKNLERFRSGDVTLLIATDLGGRGLDIDSVDRVINVNLPKQVENYLHRVGRTARAGRDGLVVNLVTQRDQTLLAKVEKIQRRST